MPGRPCAPAFSLPNFKPLGAEGCRNFFHNRIYLFIFKRAVEGLKDEAEGERGTLAFCKLIKQVTFLEEVSPFVSKGCEDRVGACALRHPKCHITHDVGEAGEW